MFETQTQASGIHIKIDLEKIDYPSDGNQPSQFYVTATNVSREFAQLQIRVYPKDYSDSDYHQWYHLQPLVTAKKPPGAKTEFTVEVINSPILGFEGIIPLVVHVFSPENPKLFAKQEIHLQVHQPKQLIELDIQATEQIEKKDKNGKKTIFFTHFPDRENEIKVKVRNLRQKAIDVDLSFEIAPTGTALDRKVLETWNVKFKKTAGKISQLKIAPHGVEIDWILLSFPELLQTEENYTLQITATPKSEGESLQEVCSFNIHCKGRIKLHLLEEKQVKLNITQKLFNLFHFPAKIEKELEIENLTSLKRKIELTIDKKYKNISFRFELNPVDIDRGETEKVKVISEFPPDCRPWFRPKLLKFEIAAKLQPPQPNILVNPDPPILHLDLKPRFLLPLLLLLGLVYLGFTFPKGHTDIVNSVSTLDPKNQIFSGSNDRTIRQWHAQSFWGKIFPFNASKKAISEKETQFKIRTIEAISDSDLGKVIVAAGLEEGNIQVWNLTHFKPTLQWSKNTQDSILDLQFMNVKDRSYLFSAHGSGWVRQWDVTHSHNDATQQIYLTNGAIYTITPIFATSGRDRDLMAIGGQSNTLAFWDLETQRVYVLEPEDLKTLKAQEDRDDLSPFVGKDKYITHVAATDNRLVVADNQGYIQVWDVGELRQCIQRSAQPLPSLPPAGKNYYQFSCSNRALQWIDRHSHGGQPVRSVAIAKHRQCYYLASVGDDGQVLLQSFSSQSKRPKSQTIAQSNTQFNTVNLTFDPDRNEPLIVTGDDDSRVQLYHPSLKYNADCR
jgi:WD40 repeat protein